jgi:uncharacterized protein involved in type VI secretion and phage assembly
VSNVLGIMRRVAVQEITQQRTTHLGKVTATFPHASDDDNNNYEVSVKLKHEDLELARVPLAVPHIGVAAPPRVGDLVLVQFINGDLNQPVVTGRFYTEEGPNRPPLHKDGEVLFEHRGSNNKLNHLRFAEDGSVIIQQDVTKPEDNSKAKATIKIAGDTGDIVLQAGADITITLKNDSEIEIKANNKPVKIECSKLTVEGPMDVNGDLKVSGGGGSTTISGHNITGT